MFSPHFEHFIYFLLLSSVSGGSIYDKFQQNDFKLKFERVDVHSYSKQIWKRLDIVTFKYNRTCTAANGTFELNVDIGNDIQAMVQVYKFASNEYRLFPLRLQVDGCTAMAKNVIGVGKFLKSGNFTGCPMEKGKLFRIFNWTPDESKFPPFIPSGRYKMDLHLFHRNTEFVLLNGYGEVYRPVYAAD